MWLAPLRIFYVTLCLFMMAQQAAAQNNQQVAPLPPPTGGLQTQNPPQGQFQGQFQGQPVYGQPLAPAPVIEPMLSPQDQAARDARLLAEQQRNAAAANTATTTGMPNEAMPGMAAPAGTMATNPNTMQGQQQIQQQPVQMLVPQNGGMPVPVQQQVTTQQQQPAPQQPAAEEKPAPVAETPAPQQRPTQQASSMSNTAGFAPAGANTTLPLTSGMMPGTNNAGMDMSINPNLVGGYDANMPAGPNNQVPYEVQLEQRTQELQQKARDMAYEQAKKSSLPMETYEIRDVLNRLKDTQEAIQTPVRPAPKPGNVIKTISADPAAKPQIIHLAAGNVTTLNVVDITGSPWPIVDIGFGGAFDVKPPEPGGHVIRITPLKDFARGNLVIRLLKMTTPLTFSLTSGGKTVDYRFDARIPEYGPNAKMPLIDNGIHAVAGDKVTTAFLEGVPPNGSEKLKVEGIDARTSAYRFGGSMYVRTPLTLLSPAWNGSATSADGMNVYVLNDAPVLLLSDKGSLVRAKLTDNKKTMGF